MEDHDLKDVKGNRLIVRYTPNERTNHWITAITFVTFPRNHTIRISPADNPAATASQPTPGLMPAAATRPGA